MVPQRDVGAAEPLQGRRELFDQHLDAIVAAMEEANFVELASDRLIVHGDSMQ